MHTRIAMATMAVLAFTACGSGGGSSNTPQGTPIRTAPWETTVPDTETTPLPTAYRTLPSVTLAPPTWAPATWQTTQVELFTELVAEELEALGAVADVVTERGYALLSSGTRIPLTGLAQRLATLPEDAWREEVSSYLVTALRPNVPDDYADFAIASPLVRVRVGEPAAIGVDPTRVASQELAPGLLAVPVVAGPERSTTITLAQVDAWETTVAELVTLGAGQTLTQLAEPHREGIFVSLLDDPFAASCVLDPSGIAGDVGDDGVLVLIPNADICLLVVVDRTLDIDTILGLYEQAKGDFAARADPVSDDLYWWHAGVLEAVPVVDGELVFPEALADAFD